MSAQTPTRRTRNYAGDVALALAIAGIVGAIVFGFPAWTFFALLGALALGIIALATTRTDKSRTTAIIAIVAGSAPVAFALLYIVANR